jgi:hypothetical protein
LDPDMEVPADFADRDRQIEATAKWLGGDYANTGQPVPQQTRGVQPILPSVVPTEVSGAAGESEVEEEASPERAAAVHAIMTKVRGWDGGPICELTTLPRVRSVRRSACGASRCCTHAMVSPGNPVQAAGTIRSSVPRSTS